MRHLLALTLLLAQPAQAFTPSLPPGATETLTRQETGGIRFPTGPFRAGAQPMASAVTATTRVLRVPGAGRATPLDALVTPLRDSLTAAGYRLLADCSAEDCGGFEFRFALPLVPEPDMHVDLARYHALIAQSGVAWLIAVISQSPETGFIQITETTGAGTAPPPTPAAPAIHTEPDGALGTKLLSEGHVLLSDASFAAGTSTLSGNDFPLLTELATWLAADASRKVMLVGHTDADGSLEANIAVSRKRAQAVRDKLIALGAPAAQLKAEGAGYLAPRASNRSPEGRTINRRVEAVLEN